AFRIREGAGHLVGLSFTARIGTLLVGSVRLTPIRIGEIPALLLGPLTVEPPFRRRGIGLALMQRALMEAKHQGHRLVVLVGDDNHGAAVGLVGAAAESASPGAGSGVIPKGRPRLPGRVAPAGLRGAALGGGASGGVGGPPGEGGGGAGRWGGFFFCPPLRA